MQQVDCIAKLLGFQGFYVRGMRIQKDEDVEKVMDVDGRFTPNIARTYRR